MGHGSASRQAQKKHNQTVNVDEIDLSSQESAGRGARTARQPNESVQTSVNQRLSAFKKLFRERLIDFLEKCLCLLSEGTLKRILSLMDNRNDAARLIELLAGEQMAKYVQSCSAEFKSFMVELLVRKFQALHLQGSRNATGTASRGAKAPATQRNKPEREAFGTQNSQRLEPNGVGAGDSTRYQSSKQRAAAQGENRQAKAKECRDQKSSASRTRAREQPGAASVGQSDNLNQTYTSLRSQVRRDADPQELGRTQRGKAHGPLTEQERRLCDISRVLHSLLDNEAHTTFLNAIKSCLQQQMCLSGEAFIKEAQLERFSAGKTDDVLGTQRKQAGEHRRPCTTFSPSTKRKS